MYPTVFVYSTLPRREKTQACPRSDDADSRLELEPRRRRAPLEEAHRAGRHIVRRKGRRGWGGGAGEERSEDRLRALEVVQRARVEAGPGRVVFATLWSGCQFRLATSDSKTDAPSAKGRSGRRPKGPRR